MADPIKNPGVGKGNSLGIQWQSHRQDQVMEDVVFLCDTGLSFPDACKRVGKHFTTVERLFERAGKPVPGRVPQEEEA